MTDRVEELAQIISRERYTSIEFGREYARFIIKAGYVRNPQTSKDSGLWEYFCDGSYYYLWFVRRKDKTAWGECFHVQSELEADDLCELLNSIGQPKESGLQPIDRNNFANWAMKNGLSLEQIDECIAKFGHPPLLRPVTVDDLEKIMHNKFFKIAGVKMSAIEALHIKNYSQAIVTHLKEENLI